jgi:hypothetical protein
MGGGENGSHYRKGKHEHHLNYYSQYSTIKPKPLMSRTIPKYTRIAAEEGADHDLHDLHEEDDMAYISLFDAGIVMVSQNQVEDQEESYDAVESGKVGIMTDAIPQNSKRITSTAFALFSIAAVGLFAMAACCHFNNNYSTGNGSTTDYSISSSSRDLAQCPVDVKMTCQGCELKIPEVDFSCVQAPNQLGMLFRGGSCEENAFTQPIMPITCVDYNGGPPKLASNETAFIRARDETNNEIVFQGTVREGDVYNITTSNGEALGSMLTIDIFADDSQQTPLQSVTFEVTCSSVDEPTNATPLLNVFGASQIINFSNDVQGTVSAFAAVQVPDMTFNIELSSTETVTLQELTVRTNVEPSSLEKFPTVTGSVISIADPLQVSFQLPFNSGVSSVDNIVRGVGVTKDGEECLFTSFESFPVTVA